MYYKKLVSFTKGIVLNTSRARQSKGFFEDNSYHNLYLTTQDGLKIGVAMFPPPVVNSQTKFVIFLHGVGCNRDDMSEIGEVKYFTRRNVLLLIPDYRGFGDSEGEFDIQKVNLDILSCCDFLREEFKAERVSLIGFSLGTAIASEYVKYQRMSLEGRIEGGIDRSLEGSFNNDKDRIEGRMSFNTTSLITLSLDKLILISPFCTLPGVLESFRIYTFFSFCVPFLKKAVESELNYDTLSNLEFISKDKVFLFHGSYDTLVPLKHSLKIKERYDCYLKILPSDHVRILLNEEMWEEIGRIL